MQLAPPVMPAQLIQALYNIVDILFVGRYSALGLTEMSIAGAAAATLAGQVLAALLVMKRACAKAPG